MQKTVLAYYKVETLQGKRFRLKLLMPDAQSYQLYYRRGGWFSGPWEPLDDTFPDPVFVPAIIGRHFGYTAKWNKL